MKTSITDIYTEIESAIENPKRDRDLTNYLKQAAGTTEDKEVKQQLQWEIAALDFCLEDGELLPAYSRSTEDGTTLWQYPSSEDFGTEGFDYLRRRINEVKSDLLMARYNFILWKIDSESKNQQQAKNAIEAYGRLLSGFTIDKTDDDSSWILLSIFKNGCTLSFEINYCTDQWKSFARNLLIANPDFDNVQKLGLIKFMLQYKQFSKDDFQNVLELLDNYAMEMNKQGECLYANIVLEEAIRVAHKTGENPKPLHRKTGENYVALAKERNNDKTGMIPLIMYEKAIDSFRKAGAKDKVQYAQKKYSAAKKNLRLNTIPIHFDIEILDSLLKHYTNKAEKLVGASPEVILSYLTSGDDIFPGVDLVKAFSEKGYSRSFLDLVTEVRFDGNKNIKPSSSSNQKELDKKLMEAYDLYVRMTVLPYVRFIFTKALSRGKLDFYQFMKFLIDHSWLGKTYEDLDSAGEIERHNWLSLIAPSIQEFVNLTQSAMKSGNPQTNYVLCIDSLSMKIEGILRHFCQLLGGSTTVAGKHGKLREMYIEELMETPELRTHFDEDDRILFKYLFASGISLDIRTQVAHTFYRYKNYGSDIMHLLLIALLRIGKYNIKDGE